MTLSRRSFLKGAGALGFLLPARLEAKAAEADIFATPLTVERRNGIPYRAFGRTGAKVSILGVGGFHIGVPEESEGIRIVRTTIDEVMPLALERKIAVIAMKTQGGGLIPQKAGVTPHECLRYSMSLNVPVCLSGMKTLDEAQQNVAFTKTFSPLTTEERSALLAKVEPLAGAGVLERFKSTQRYDSEYHQRQHGFQ